MSRLKKLRKAVKRFLEKGWRFVPIPPNEKAPKIKGWPNLRIEKAEFDKYFSEDSNIGLLTGEPSGGLMDVDLDCPQAVELAPEFLPYTGRVHGRKSKPKSHRWQIADPIPASEKYCDVGKDGTCLLELRSTGQQTVVPPSVHPSGELIEWDSRKRPAKVDGGELRSATARLAAATLFARHWPSKGSRNAAAMALAGTLLRAGRDEIEVGDFVAAVARAAGDEEWASRKATARSTRKRLDKDEPATGRQRLAEVMGADVVDRACQWLGIESVRTWSPRLSQHRVPWPEPLSEEALYGLAGDVVRTIAPETEADPAGLLIQFLVGFGNLTGRNAYLQIGATRHYANLYTGSVGQTSKSRKGTSWNEIFRLLSDVDPDWASKRRIAGGIGSGEGLIWAVRDPQDDVTAPKASEPSDTADATVEDFIVEKSRKSKGKDPGVDDKRLLVVEAEFASTLRVMGREKSIVSSVIRTAWDSGDLNNLTKNSPARATGAHISLVIHITVEELRREMTATDMANGFANRFLWTCVRRARHLLPFGGNVDPSALKKLVSRLRSAASFAQGVQEVWMSMRARRLWRRTYPSLSAEVPGLLGAVTSRAEAQVVRLAMIYALLDRSRFIESRHLSAALAVWRYCEDSARYIFGDALGDPTADAILRELRRQPNGLTRNEIRELFSRNRPEAETSRALSFLLANGWVSCVQEQTGGRPSERWTATR
jgi:bifunctional DNA primase/polymerase-like protein